MSSQTKLWKVLTAACVLAGAYAGQAATPTPPASRPAESQPAARAARGGGESEARPAAGGEGRGAAAPARGGRGAAAAPANLESAMSDMNRMLAALKREAADPAQAEQALRDLATMQRDVAISKLLTPPNVNGMAKAEDKAKALASYRAMMNGLTRTLLDLEDAVNDKKPDEIKKLIAALDEVEKMGHTEFNVKPD